ncbi:MAG: DUF1007 family protein [Hyphomicrobiaceae bacterium]|nr:MAG: DUF1007 family protein [Hyphomicrobiaceae bacterium]
MRPLFHLPAIDHDSVACESAQPTCLPECPAASTAVDNRTRPDNGCAGGRTEAGIALMRLISRFLSALAAIAAAGFALAPGPAGAHPHVWVTVEAKAITGPDGAITGVRHKWTFDELYSQFAVQGLDKKGGNDPSKEDLQELAETNIQSLKDFDYFTYPKLNDKKIGLKSPTDYHLELKDGLLSLHFTVPFAQAAVLPKDKLSFSVTDPSFFIAFEFAKEKPVGFTAEPPKGCSIALQTPEQEKAEMKKLADSFNKSLAQNQSTDIASDTAVVTCK